MFFNSQSIGKEWCHRFYFAHRNFQTREIEEQYATLVLRFALT